MRAAHIRGGAIHAGRIPGGRYGAAGRPRPVHPIAGRPGRPGYPIAGRPGRPIAGYPGGYYPWRGAAYGAAVGAAAAGAYGYYGDDYGYPYYANYGYDDGDYGYGGCYIAQQRVLTPYGWRLRQVEVCN